jgi:hypothetical protein
MKIAGMNPRLSGAAVLLALSGIFFAGCFGRKHAVSNFEYSHETQGARMPAFLMGPAAALLTNASGFSAHLTMEQTDLSNKVTAVTGQLLVRGPHLLFAPKTGDNAFVWDVQDRNGFILSEALQGYAPVSSPVHITKVMVLSETAGPTGEEVNGHPGHEAEVAVTSDDGTTATFGVWRATDLNGFPVRIRSLKGPVAFTLNLSGARSEDLSLKLFQPPEGFTKYPSSDAMVGELFARKSKSKNISNGSAVEPHSGVNYSH